MIPVSKGQKSCSCLHDKAFELGTCLLYTSEIDTKVNNVKSIVGNTYTYQVGTSMTDVPTGEWLTSMPNVPQGQYLWTKETTLYSDATTSVGYIATRMGVDGAGGATGPAGPQGPQGNQGGPMSRFSTS